jgi:hypothetical protein
MTTSALGPASTTSIYTPSTETFIEDFDAYVTLDLV